MSNKKGTLAELVSISNIWSRYFIYKGNILLILYQLHELNLEQNLTNCSSFTYHMSLTRPIQTLPPTPPLHTMVLIFSSVCLYLFCDCPFLGIVILSIFMLRYSKVYPPPKHQLKKPPYLSCSSYCCHCLHICPQMIFCQDYRHSHRSSRI